MDVLILNRQFQTECIIDGYESFIWTDRYNAAGDTEIYMPVEKAPMQYIQEQYYLWRKGTDRLMIIEDVLITTDAENAPHITITGRSLESILERRIVFYRTIINGNLQNGIEQLLNENVIDPDVASRKIPEFRFVRNDDPRIADLTCDLNLFGEDLLSVIQGQCDINDLGFKVIYNETDGTFDFMLYYGEDRSYNQEKNLWVVFSPDFDNLSKSSYYNSIKNLRTAAVIAGSESSTEGQEIVDIDESPDLIGLDRREAFIDASNVQKPHTEVDEDAIRRRMRGLDKTDSEISSAISRAKAQAEKHDIETYRKQLEDAGREALIKTYITQSFDGEIEASRQYVYGRDFFIGDIVQIRDEYGKEAASRITEVVMSHDVNGETLIPTFTSLLGGDNISGE